MGGRRWRKKESAPGGKSFGGGTPARGRARLWRRDMWRAQRVEADGVSAASGARTSVLSAACKAAGDIIQRAGSIWSAVCKVAGMCKKSLNNKDNLQKCPVLRF